MEQKVSQRRQVKVLIAIPSKDGVTYAQIIKKDQFTITIPSQASEVIDLKTLLSIEEIITRLTDRGIILVKPLYPA